MEDSAAFAAKHGLTVERPVPEMEEVPTATCQVIARVGLGWVGLGLIGLVRSSTWVGVVHTVDVLGVLGGWMGGSNV